MCGGHRTIPDVISQASSTFCIFDTGSLIVLVFIKDSIVQQPSGIQPFPSPQHQGYKTHPDLFLRCRWSSGSAAHRESTVQTDLSPPFMTTAFLKSRRRRSLTLTNALECLVGLSQCHIHLHSHLAVRTEHGGSVVSPKAEHDSSRSGE